MPRIVDLMRLTLFAAVVVSIVGIAGCGETAPTSPMRVPPTTQLTSTPPPSVASAALTASGGVAVIAQILIDSGFDCIPNDRFTSCRSISDEVRVAAWAASDGAATEIDATFQPSAESGEVGAVLSLLDRIAPGTEAAIEAFRASEANGPHYQTIGRVDLTLTRDANGTVSAVIRLAR